MTSGAAINADAGEKRLLERMIVFSDAIFAFAVTLLALELKPPQGDVAEWRFETAVRLVVFATTFVLIAIFWAGHLATTRRLQRFSWLVLWINLVFLLTIVLMPFASSLLVSHLDQEESWRYYSFVMIVAAAGQTLLSVVLHSGGGRLVGGATARDVVHRALRASSPGVAFAGGLVLLDRYGIDAARWCWVFIFPMLMLASLFAPRKPKAPKAQTARSKAGAA